MILFKIFDGIKRAFTKQPIGKILDILDQTKGESRFSWEYVVALTVRLVFAVIILWAAQYFGVSVETILEIIAQLFGVTA